MNLWPDNWINWTLAKEPLNWAIVWVLASIWLLFFHVVMVAFHSLGGSQASIGAAPGQVAMLPDATQSFTAPSRAGGAADLDRFLSGGWIAASPWADDGIVAKFAEDGWTGNS